MDAFSKIISCLKVRKKLVLSCDRKQPLNSTLQLKKKYNDFHGHKFNDKMFIVLSGHCDRRIVELALHSFSDFKIN